MQRSSLKLHFASIPADSCLLQTLPARRGHGVSATPTPPQCTAGLHHTSATSVSATTLCSNSSSDSDKSSSHSNSSSSNISLRLLWKLQRERQPPSEARTAPPSPTQACCTYTPEKQQDSWVEPRAQGNSSEASPPPRAAAAPAAAAA
ncbi:hypothetical protein Emed_007424 [Eimeria media]